MGYQFIHLEAYSRKGVKGRSTGFVFGEGKRDLEASVHVDDPRPPETVWGMEPSEVEELHDRLADDTYQTLANGRQRRIRRDQATLLTAVASHPYYMTDAAREDALLKTGDQADRPSLESNPELWEEIRDWEQRTVEWMRERYGDQVKTAFRHTDESHPHLHIWIVPDEDPLMRAKTVHDGYAAKEEARERYLDQGYQKKEANRLADRDYNAAMRQFQGDYADQVAQHFGLTRTGPQRERLTREEWIARQQAARENADLTREISRKKDEVARLQQQAEQAALMANRVQELQMQMVAARTAAQQAVQGIKEEHQAEKALLDQARREKNQQWAHAEEQRALMNRREADLGKMARRRQKLEERVKALEERRDRAVKAVSAAEGFGAKLHAAWGALTGKPVEKRIEQVIEKTRSEERQRAEKRVQKVRNDANEKIGKAKENVRSLKADLHDERTRRQRLDAELEYTKAALDRAQERNQVLEDRLDEVDPERRPDQEGPGPSLH